MPPSSKSFLCDDSCDHTMILTIMLFFWDDGSWGHASTWITHKIRLMFETINENLHRRALSREKWGFLSSCECQSFSVNGSTYVAERGEGFADVAHGVVSEGHEGVVGGEGVPPGGEGGFSQPVPEHSHPLAFPPETHRDGDNNTGEQLSLLFCVSDT